MIYLDNGATTWPKPEAVYRRVDEVARTIGGNPGRSSHRMALDAARVIYKSRELLGELLGVSDASRIAFTKNATEAINIALKGYVNEGDHIITTSFEHNSVAKTVRWLEGRGVTVTWLPGDSTGLVTPEAVADAITDKTTLLTITHASNVFGTIQPIREIGRVCRERGVTLMVDGAQTVGAIPVNVADLAIDILAGTGHKALFGPQGTGFLYLRDGLEVRPLIEGGTGDEAVDIEMPDKLETGTMNTSGIGGLGAGIEFILKEGVGKIRAFEEALTDRMLAGLSAIRGVSILGPMSAADRVGLVTFNIDGYEPTYVGTVLDEEYDIMVRAGIHCAPMAHKRAGTDPEGGVRASITYFNREEDVDSLIKGAEEIISL